MRFPESKISLLTKSHVSQYIKFGLLADEMAFAFISYRLVPSRILTESIMDLRCYAIQVRNCYHRKKVLCRSHTTCGLGVASSYYINASIIKY